MDAWKNNAAEAGRSKWTMHSNHNIKCFTASEIKRMTDNYKTIIGTGAFGKVYKGVLKDISMVVAVKKLIRDGKENFDKELIVHRAINHRNVVRLIGYCVEKNALMTVTEFIPNGDLSGILHRNCTSIPLDVRLRIATQCAEALAYMHSYMYTQVIHGDIKPDNILLDSNYNARLSDFGISRLVNTDKTLYTDYVKGSIGYMDPLFLQDGCLTMKSDVYSFGIVLLELLTRKKVTTKVGEVSLVTVFTNALKSGRIEDVRKLFDSDLDPLRNYNILYEVGKLAAECLKMKRDKRPEMKHVAERLGKSIKAYLDEVGKLAAECLKMRRDKHPEMKHVAERLGKSTKASLERKHMCRRFSYAEMVAATSNFSESLVLGPGHVGRFYRGVIDGGATIVAVERSWHWDHHHHDSREARQVTRKPANWHDDELSTKPQKFSLFAGLRTSLHDDDGHLFHSFVKSRSGLNHVNIVPLIGYCDENDEKILVYTYMDEGSLHEHLFETQNPLTWKQRLKICIGVACGLHYLHRDTKHGGPIWFAPRWNCVDQTAATRLERFEAATANIVHHNLKVNILLDKELVGKISANKIVDPGLNELEGCGTSDPDFGDLTHVTHWLTEKLVVYSFGTLLLEVLCARPHFDLGDPGEKVNLQAWVRRCKGDLNWIDPYLKGKINPQCCSKFLQTTEKCLAHRGVDRPSLQDVASDLESALQVQLQAETAEAS